MLDSHSPELSEEVYRSSCPRPRRSLFDAIKYLRDSEDFFAELRGVTGVQEEGAAAEAQAKVLGRVDKDGRGLPGHEGGKATGHMFNDGRPHLCWKKRPSDVAKWWGDKDGCHTHLPHFVIALYKM